MSAAIYYHPEAYTTSGPKLMGRNAAGQSFLRGYLAYSKTNEFWVQVQDVAHAQHFVETARAQGRNEQVKAVDNTRLMALAEANVVYFPGPAIGKHAWHRAAHGHGAWSLCGITHTTSSETAMDAIAELLTTPVQPWDALICTSTAVKDNVQRVLQAQTDYLQKRLGITKAVLPQLPVIPLGIHTGDFVFTREQKAAARQVLGVAADTVVVLYTGRLSFHAKAHPLAMYQALQSAADASGKSVVLVECGWHANEHIAKSFAAAAQLACPDVRVITLDGRKAEERQTAWAGADVFCSLSDNIQETFGIVPIEAMAAGLPVVVSDWDGYKDTVRDGVDGFRVPTLMPGVGLGVDLAQRHALGIDSYDMYCGHACTFVAIDVAATAEAFTRLFQDAALRQRMGAAGRERAQNAYDWRTIIPQYEALWAQLADLRTAQAPALEAVAHPWPARLDPYHAFASYPTQILTPQMRFSLVDANAQNALVRARSYRQLTMIDYAKAVLPSDKEIEAVLQAAVSPKTAGELLQHIPAARQASVFRALAWLVKMHVLRVVV
jgi:glycosyltransferase involved in cell wall biosynthesis